MATGESAEERLFVRLRPSAMASSVLWVSGAAASATAAAWPLPEREGVEGAVWLQSVLPPLPRPPDRLRRGHRRCCSGHALPVGDTHWRRMAIGRKWTTVVERKRPSSAVDDGGDFGFLGRYYCCCYWRVNRTNLPRRQRGRPPMMMMKMLLLRLMMMMKVVVERKGWSDQMIQLLLVLLKMMMMISVSCCFRRHHHRRRRAVGSDSDSEEREIIISVCSAAAVDSGSAAASAVAARSCPSTGTWPSSPMVSKSEMNTLDSRRPTSYHRRCRTLRSS